MRNGILILAFFLTCGGGLPAQVVSKAEEAAHRIVKGLADKAPPVAHAVPAPPGNSILRSRGASAATALPPAPAPSPTDIREGFVPYGYSLVPRGPRPDGPVNKAQPGGLPAPAPPTAPFSDIKQPADLARGAIYRLVVHADKVAEFPDIQFELGSWKIQEGESKELVRGAGVGILILMNAHSDWRFLIEGHTCDIGESSYNARLSWLRAFAVCSELGLPPDLMTRLVPLGCGEKYAKQLSGNSACLEQLRAPERRVRIWVLSKDS